MLLPGPEVKLLVEDFCQTGPEEIYCFRRLGQAIGIKISTHYLRHTAITLALELGEPLQKVQAYARHASANTTVRYFHDQQLLEKNPTDTLPAL